MRRPDLDYLLLNTFESLVLSDFFTCQELLFGKSLCDICLNTPKFIVQALETWKCSGDEDHFIKKTNIYQLVKND